MRALNILALNSGSSSLKFGLYRVDSAGAERLFGETLATVATADDPDAMARFDRGVKNVSVIAHPNVCTIYDFGHTADGLQYVAMEFIAGESLAEVLAREGPFTARRAIRVADQIASALQAAQRNAAMSSTNWALTRVSIITIPIFRSS